MDQAGVGTQRIKAAGTHSDLLQINARDRTIGRISIIHYGDISMFKISLLVWMMLGTALAGTAVITVLAVPSLAAQAMKNIPLAVLIGFAVAMPLSYLVARKIGASPVR
jgi:hypothetical protein